MGSIHENQSFPSDTSADQELGTPLRHIVAVYQLDDGRPYFTIEVAYLEEETNQSSTMSLQFNDPEEMMSWLMAIRTAANRARLLDDNPISAYNSETTARAVEREGDYEPPNYAVYKVIQRPKHGGSRSSSDDLQKVVSTAYFLVIGAFKVHLVPITRITQRTSSPSLSNLNSQIVSFGILSLTALHINDHDDNFELTFRLPLQKPKVLYLASLASHDIAVRLHHVEGDLRPEWESRPYTYMVPDEVKQEIFSSSGSHLAPHQIGPDSFDRTLVAYCIAYEVNPGNIRYGVFETGEDVPRFELHPPEGRRRREYTALEILAVMRSLRYLESYRAISFANVPLDVLNGLHDLHGSEHVCSRTKKGTPVSMTVEDLGRSCLLIQEIRALAVTSKKLRKMDFTGSISREPQNSVDGAETRDMGCGIVEALFPLCKHQTTNVDWIVLNLIPLGETDLDYLVAAAVERRCHLRAIEMSRCGLNDRSLSLILDALRAQDNTLEAINIAGNVARVSPTMFHAQLNIFGFIRRLNLSNVARTTGSEPLVSAETLCTWKLEELLLSGTALNEEDIEAVAVYLRSPRSNLLSQLHLDHTYLTGGKLAYLMQAMNRGTGHPRELHLNASQNPLEKDFDRLTTALASGFAPAMLTMRLVEFTDESHFCDLILALSMDKSIRELDISRASLPHDASEGTCQALEKMFRDNTSLQVLDVSGEDSRLETSKLGVGINRALRGLEFNRTLRVLKIQYQKLGLQGSSTLADVLKVNQTLQEIHCENNGIPLSGFTDLINALHRNTTLLYLSPLTDSRFSALRQTERQVKAMRDETAATTPASPTSKASFLKTKLPGTKASKEKATSAGLLSDQDINAALRLVDESWQRQDYRLTQYLERNVNIANGIHVDLDVDDEVFERPDERPMTADRLSRVIENVKMDSTPTLEKQVQLGDHLEMAMTSGDPTSPLSPTQSSFEKALPLPPWNAETEVTPRTEKEIDLFSSAQPHPRESIEGGREDPVFALAKELDISLGHAQDIFEAQSGSRHGHGFTHGRRRSSATSQRQSHARRPSNTPQKLEEKFDKLGFD